MKTKTQIIQIITLIFFYSGDLSGDGLSLPAGNAGIEDLIGGAPAPEPTMEELADPPAGEIQKLYLRNVNESRAGLAALLAQVPAGPNGQQSPLFAKLQSINTGLDQLASSSLESQLFSLIPMMVEVFAAESEDVPKFVGDSIGWLQNISPPILHTVARHITQQSGNVATGNLTNFVKLFASPNGFISLGDWEDQPKPINAAGVMILDAASVVAQLKAGPWKQSKQFLGGADDAASYFSMYTANGNGLAVLKTKYLQNQATIDAGFVELKIWVAQQEAASVPP
jgi:hypothetical protein